MTKSMTLFAFACRHAANFKETYEKMLKRREILFIRWEGMSIFCGGMSIFREGMTSVSEILYRIAEVTS